MIQEPLASQPESELAESLFMGASALTPFTSNDEVDEQALRVQLRRFVGAGLGVWLVSSGTAEGNVPTPPEIDRIAEVAVDEIAGATQVYAMGPEPRSAREAIDFARRMHDRGVDAVQVGPVDPGHSYLPTTAELRFFYDTVLDAIEMPCFLATHMSVGYEVDPDVLLSVATERTHQVIGINATHLRNYVYLPRLMDTVGQQVPVHVGSPVHALEGLALGASGIVSSMDINVAPTLYADLRDAWGGNRSGELLACHARIMRLFLRILGAGGLVVAKAILVRLGVEVGTTRAPRRPADESTFRAADGIIEEFRLRA
jgi:4-hydroxy-tetrahydrodipicolinate synthase